MLGLVTVMMVVGLWFILFAVFWANEKQSVVYFLCKVFAADIQDKYCTRCGCVVVKRRQVQYYEEETGQAVYRDEFVCAFDKLHPSTYSANYVLIDNKKKFI